MIVREIIARFGVQADASQVRRLDQGLDGLMGKLRGLGAALAGGFVANALKNWVGNLIDVGDELGDTSAKVGLSAQQLQLWRFAAERSGASGEGMTAALFRLQRAAVDAAAGTEESASAFRTLGVSVRNQDGSLKTTDQLLHDVAAGMALIPDHTQRVALAQRVLGRSGGELVPLLARGADGVAELEARFRELGGGATAEFVEQAGKADDALIDWGVTMDSVKSKIAVALLPTVTRMVEVVGKAATAFATATEKSHLLEAALVVLGPAVLAFGAKFAIANAAALVIAAGLVILVLVVDELITLFSGGRTVIGTFIDEMFGLGSAAQVVNDLKDAWQGLVDTMRAAGQFLGMDVSALHPNAALAGGSATFDPELARRSQETAARSRTEREEAITRLTPIAQGRGRRAREAQQALDAIHNPPTRARTRSVPVLGTTSRQSVPVVNAPTQVTINTGADPQAVERVVTRSLDRRNREAAAALVQEAEE